MLNSITIWTRFFGDSGPNPYNVHFTFTAHKKLCEIYDKSAFPGISTKLKSQLFMGKRTSSD